MNYNKIFAIFANRAEVPGARAREREREREREKERESARSRERKRGTTCPGVQCCTQASMRPMMRLPSPTARQEAGRKPLA
jgi:hypothetical protein